MWLLPKCSHGCTPHIPAPFCLEAYNLNMVTVFCLINRSVAHAMVWKSCILQVHGYYLHFVIVKRFLKQPLNQGFPSAIHPLNPIWNYKISGHIQVRKAMKAIFLLRLPPTSHGVTSSIAMCGGLVGESPRSTYQAYGQTRIYHIV